MTDQTIISLPDLKAVDETAAHWIMHLEDGTASKAVRAEFQEWYVQSDRHKDAIDKLSSLWAGMDMLTDLNDMAIAGADMATAKQNRSPITRQIISGLIAASIFLVIGFVVVQNIADLKFSHTYATKIGEQETVHLPDGSDIILNTNTEIHVEFTKFARNIKLERGEAYFQVAKDKTKPFSVQTEKGTVTAVGTAFSVRVLEQKIDVVVTEGRVALSAIPKTLTDQSAKQPVKTAALRTIMEVTAGQAASFAGHVESLAPITHAAIEHKLDWRDGVLAFKGETLEQVVTNIARYTELFIDISDADLRQQPIAGYFKVGETEALFDALNIMAGVEIEYVAVGHIRLYRKQ